MSDRNTGIGRDQLKDYTLKRQDLSPDGLVWQEPVIDKDATTPPGSPSADNRYLVISGGSGTDWSGHDNDIAHYHSGQWNYYTPIEGWMVWIKDEDEFYRYNGSTWAIFGSGTDEKVKASSGDPTSDYLDGKIDDFTIKISNYKLKVADRIELNTMLNAFRIAINGSLSQFNMTDGISDEFEDETGIDTVNSTNEDYDSTNDLYKPTTIANLELDYMEYASDGAAQTAYVTSGGATYGSDITSGQTYNESSFYDAGHAGDKVFDDTSTPWWSGNTQITNQWVSVQWSSGKIITKITLQNASATDAIKDAKLEGSNNGSSWTKIPATGWDGSVCSQRATDEWTTAQTATWGWVTFNNSTSYTYYRIYVFNNFGAPSNMSIHEMEMMESSGNELQCYSEASIKNQGSYSLKAIAVITDSLNDTLTKSGLSIDLTDKDTLKFDVYASRTGTNLRMKIHDSGGTTSTKDIVISSADTWETTTWDISGISNANKDDIDSIIIEIINADSANTFYIDNFYALGLTNNMTLISNSFTAESAPSDARLVLFEEDVDSVTENTDIRAYISRDGGSTYAQVTLSDEGNYESGKRILTGTVDLTQSGVGSGTNMEYKVTTLNNKSLKLHGVGLHWD